MIEATVDSMSAHSLIQAFDMFEDEDLRERLLLSALESLRQQKIDIRQLNLTQMSKLVKLVGLYSSKDLKVFFNYIDTAFSAQLYKVTPANFQPMTEMFYLFVQEGFFTPSRTNKFYFTYLLALKNEIMKTSN